MSTPPEATRHNNLTKLLVLLSLRASSKSTFQYETPCIIVFVAKLSRFTKSFSKCELHDFLVLESKGHKISKENDLILISSEK